MSTKITEELFEKTFGSIMLHGLDSLGTYIPLRINKKYGINVAIRPVVMRSSEGVVLFGGKLRVGYTLDDNLYPIKTSVTEISDAVRVQRLKDYCKGFKWQSQDETRFSTFLGFGIAASKYDGAAALKGLQDNKIAENLINGIEATYKQYNDISFGSRKSVALAIDALNMAWVLQSENEKIFTPLPETMQLPDEVVGEQSPLLNKGQDKYKGNVVSFQQKIEELANKDSE